MNYDIGFIQQDLYQRKLSLESALLDRVTPKGPDVQGRDEKYKVDRAVRPNDPKHEFTKSLYLRRLNRTKIILGAPCQIIDVA